MSSPQPAVVLTHSDIGTYLATRTGGQMVQLLQDMRAKDPNAQAAFTTALLFAPQVVSGRATAPEKSTDKPKKALNAFVAFRCYYIEIPDFKLWPMKMLSGPIGVIWHFDPNKPLWSLMAKAWSTIRDQVGKDSAPLDRFFDIICPYLNIPPPHKYLPKLGWNLVTNDKGVPTIERDPSAPLHACDVGAETTALSTEDLIKHCLSKGYAPQYIHEQSLTSSTFLGHNLTITETAKRLVAKKKRRAQRQVGRDTGFAADLQDRMLHANTFDNPKIAEDGNVHHVMRDTADALDNEDALNTFLHEQLASAFPGAMTGISSDAEFYPQNTAVSTSYDASLANSDWNGNPFRAGADPLATLSNDESKINNWFNDDQSYSPSGAL